MGRHPPTSHARRMRPVHVHARTAMHVHASCMRLVPHLRKRAFASVTHVRAARARSCECIATRRAKDLKTVFLKDTNHMQSALRAKMMEFKAAEHTLA